jgi:hypothetical protein
MYFVSEMTSDSYNDSDKHAEDVIKVQNSNKSVFFNSIMHL